MGGVRKHGSQIAGGEGGVAGADDHIGAQPGDGDDAGVNGGLVLVAADDPGLYSSQNEQDTRCVARAAMVPVLEPSDSQEAKDFVKFETEILTEFHFVQRILNYGADCIWVDNASIRKKILEKFWKNMGKILLSGDRL